MLSDTLNTRGVARSDVGDPEWVGDLEPSLALALEIKSRRAARAYQNLGSLLASNAGEVAKAVALLREGLQFAERLGLGLSLRWFHGELADCAFILGNWEEALRLAEEEIADPEPHQVQAGCRSVRASVRLARGDRVGAVEDAEVQAKMARSIRDPQVLLPALSVLAYVLARTGDDEGATAALAELAHTSRALEASAGTWSLVLAFALLELGREAELL